MARIRKPPGAAELTPAQRAAQQAVRQRSACTGCDHTAAWHFGQQGRCSFPGCDCRVFRNRGRKT